MKKKDKTSFSMYACYTTVFVVYTHFWFVAVVIFSVSLTRKKYTCKFILPLLLQDCYRGFYQAFMLSLTTAFYIMEEKTSWMLEIILQNDGTFTASCWERMVPIYFQFFFNSKVLKS